jgi:hypothetical protein
MIKINDKLIIDGRRRVNRNDVWRRCIVIDGPRVRFGTKEVQVKIERRGRETVNKEKWLPTSFFLPRTTKNANLLGDVLTGHDDV